jgi:cytochrome b subunit of formate dehydrogenase
MKGSLESMLFGWISEEYVKSHHRRWYGESVRGKESE